VVLSKLLPVSSSFFFGRYDFCFNVLAFHFPHTEKERERKGCMNWILFLLLLYLGYHYMKERLYADIHHCHARFHVVQWTLIESVIFLSLSPGERLNDSLECLTPDDLKLYT
jgi:hypothetical protein